MENENNHRETNKYEEYIISENKEMRKEIKNLLEKVKELELEKEEIESDLSREEKKSPFLRSAAKSEYDMKNLLNTAFKSLASDRKKLIIQFNSYTFMKNLLFVIVAVSAPMAEITAYNTTKEVYCFYIWAQSIMAFIYFLCLPEFVSEDTHAIELPREAKELYTEYKTHQKEINYMDKMVDNC